MITEKKWSKLLSRIKATKLFTQSVNNKSQSRYLVYPVTLIKSLETFVPDVLKKSELNIVIAGAGSFAERLNEGDAFHVLKLFYPDITFNITMLNNEKTPARTTSIRLHPITTGKDVSVSVVRQDIQTFCSQLSVVPDAVFMFHPGFEEFKDSWFTGAAINQLIEKNIPVIGSSYGADEATLDTYYLRTQNLDAKIVDNPFKLAERITPDATFDSKMDCCGQIWLVTKAEQYDADAIKKLLSDRFELLALMFDEPAQAAMNSHNLYYKRNGKEYVHLPEGFSFSLSDWNIEHQGDVVMDDIEIDSEVISLKDEYIRKAPELIGAYIWAKYGEELGSKSFHSQMMEGLSSMIGMDDGMDDFMQTLMGKPSRTMSKSEGEVMRKLTSYIMGKTDINDIIALGDDTLRDFRNEQHQSIMHLAAKYDSLELAKLSDDIGLSVTEPDGDGFLPLDICGEKNSLLVAKWLVESKGVDIHRKDGKGFNATFRARTYGGSDVFDYLISKGGVLEGGYAQQSLAGKM